MGDSASMSGASSLRIELTLHPQAGSYCFVAQAGHGRIYAHRQGSWYTNAR